MANGEHFSYNKSNRNVNNFQYSVIKPTTLPWRQRLSGDKEMICFLLWRGLCCWWRLKLSGGKGLIHFLLPKPVHFGWRLKWSTGGKGLIHFLLPGGIRCRWRLKLSEGKGMIRIQSWRRICRWSLKWSGGKGMIHFQLPGCVRFQWRLKLLALPNMKLNERKTMLELKCRKFCKLNYENDDW